MAVRIAQRLGTWLDHISEDFIGWTFPPVQRAFDEARWNPDDARGTSYCRRCGDSVGPGEATSAGCATCGDHGELAGGIGDGLVRLGPYVNPLRGWVQAAKYQHWNEMGAALGERLGVQLQRAAMIESRETIIVPMAMPLVRRLYRGTDHARVIADGISDAIKAPVVPILSRGNGPPQVSLSPSERRRAGARRLRIRRRLGGWNLQDVDVLLVDDVRTTGATLRGAVRLLRTLKPRRIVCAVIAVSDSSARRTRAAYRHAAMRPPALPCLH
jgi:predicted amidophosphoribosyltransferase